MSFWCKSERFPTFLDYAISRDVDAVFACAAPEGCYYHHCRDCREVTVWRKGVDGLVNAYCWGADFPGDKPGYSFSGDGAPRGVTMWKGGPTKLVKVDKCTVCGRSISAGAHETGF